MERIYHYLALGDSYTIGEAVRAEENFPNQVCNIATLDHIQMEVRIIAKTGWTTDELTDGIAQSGAEKPLLPVYDFVTLLIGVNNQYRERSVTDYGEEFQDLLKIAINYSGNKNPHVVVLSIPDWGVTPFAEGRDRKRIAIEIDEYNNTAKTIALKNNCQYIDITAWTREASKDISLLTDDGLHPSGKEYRRWAEITKNCFLSLI